jgi:hypothetical protein
MLPSLGNKALLTWWSAAASAGATFSFVHRLNPADRNRSAFLD